MESVRPFVVKICGEKVVKRCHENILWCKLWCKCGENVVKRCREKTFCGENRLKSPEISLKKSCDPLINQSQT